MIVNALLSMCVVAAYFFGHAFGRRSMWEDYHNSDGTKRRAWFETPDDPSWPPEAR